MKTILVMIFGLWTSTAFGDDFFAQTFSSDNAEIELGKLANWRGSFQVKKFAIDVVDYHRKSADRVGLIMKNRQQSIVTDLEKGVIKERDELRTLKNEQFDCEYLRWVIADYYNNIAVFEWQIRNGDEIASFYARQNVDILREHLKRAKELLNTNGKVRREAADNYN